MQSTGASQPLKASPPTDPIQASPPAIIITQAAAKKIWLLIQEEGNPDLKLRVYITGGGCSGFQYGFAFEETTQNDDVVITKALEEEEEEDDDDGGDDGTSGSGGLRLVCLLVDPMSFQYLSGAEIDYTADELDERFIIRNPHAQTTCGCGSSFAVSDDRGN
jgi:iron-sulfur cluster insertion protein